LGFAALSSLAADHALGPRQVLAHLREGNRAFVAGRSLPGSRVTKAGRAALVAAQHPHTVVLTCADSRVPPEHIFNEGLGKLFVVRVAGLVADPVVTGSVEYAVEHLHTPLVVVMGHTHCGAVKAALEAPQPPPPGGPGANIESILAMLRPGIPKGHEHGDAWANAVYGGVEQSVDDLLMRSRILAEAGKAGHVGLVGAVYELESGRVVFSDMVAWNEAEHASHGALVHWVKAR